MDEIYKKIGEVVELSQYIEHNLVAINCNCKFGKVSQEEIDKLYNESVNSTLGTALNELRQSRVIDRESLDYLYSVLNDRNIMVHRFFKDHDFNKNKSKKYLRDAIEYLSDKLKLMQDINDWLCDIIDEQKSKAVSEEV